MPVYEYVCQSCDHEFEREQRISDKPVRKCPVCGALKAKRLISRTSFVLKGGGWYNDLYARPSGKKKDAEAAPKDTEAKADRPEKSDGAKAAPKKEGGSKKDGGAKGSKAAA